MVGGSSERYLKWGGGGGSHKKLFVGGEGTEDTTTPAPPPKRNVDCTQPNGLNRIPLSQFLQN